MLFFKDDVNEDEQEFEEFENQIHDMEIDAEEEGLRLMDKLSAEAALLFQNTDEIEESDPAGAYTVVCKFGCGNFYISDLDSLEPLGAESIRFRCPNCNELQTGRVIILD